jgi:hypothetical protein
VLETQFQFNVQKVQAQQKWSYEQRMKYSTNLKAGDLFLFFTVKQGKA